MQGVLVEPSLLVLADPLEQSVAVLVVLDPIIFSLHHLWVEEAAVEEEEMMRESEAQVVMEDVTELAVVVVERQ